MSSGGDTLTTGRNLVLLYAVIGLVSWLIFLLARREGVLAWLLIQDPASTQQYHPLVGALSYLAVFGWGVAATATLFAAYVLGRGARRRGILVGAGLASVVLLVDDLFSVHELYSQRWPDGREEVFFLGYALIILAVVGLFRREWTPHRPWVLVLAAVLLAGSVGIDLVNAGQYAEEALKILGIATWAYYWASLSKRVVLEELGV